MGAAPESRPDSRRHGPAREAANLKGGGGRCHECDDAATHSCADCRYLLCNDCVQHHRKARLSKTHKLEPVQADNGAPTQNGSDNGAATVAARATPEVLDAGWQGDGHTYENVPLVPPPIGAGLPHWERCPPLSPGASSRSSARPTSPVTSARRRPLTSSGKDSDQHQKIVVYETKKQKAMKNKAKKARERDEWDLLSPTTRRAAGETARPGTSLPPVHERRQAALMKQLMTEVLEVEENVVVYPEPKTDWDSRGEVWELDADTVTPPASDAWASDRSDYSSELNSEASTVEHRGRPGPGFRLVALPP